MSFTALRSIKVQTADGGYEVRAPGDKVPEAAEWENVAVWVRRGYLRPDDGRADLLSYRGVRRPMRAVTADDLAKWQDGKMARAEGELPEEPGFDAAGHIGPTDQLPQSSAPEPEPKLTAESLQGLKKKQLIEIAEEIGLAVDHKASVADLIEAILDANG